MSSTGILPAPGSTASVPEILSDLDRRGYWYHPQTGRLVPQKKLKFWKILTAVMLFFTLVLVEQNSSLANENRKNWITANQSAVALKACNDREAIYIAALRRMAAQQQASLQTETVLKFLLTLLR